MKDEVREAAERQLEDLETCHGVGHPYRDGKHNAMDDGFAVVEYVLAETDPTPIDESWLRSVGFVEDYDDLLIESKEVNGEAMGLLWNTRRKMFEIANRRGNNSTLIVLLNTPKTRSDLRRLAAALNIPLNSTPRGEV